MLFIFSVDFKNQPFGFIQNILTCWVDMIIDVWQNGQPAKFFKAMAHPSRVLIVEELTDGERCVCDLTEKIGADISTVSKHLSVMKNAGLVIDEKRQSGLLPPARPLNPHVFRLC
jgi:Bacterial regulatory protein, arsR family